jgi:hypothetical protein
MSNNQFARERDAKVIWFLKQRPATAGQLVRATIFPNEDRARKRLTRLKEKGLIHCCGYVLINGRYEKLWAKRYVSKPQHDAEITEIALKLLVEDFISNPDDQFKSDYLLKVQGRAFRGEHDRDTKNGRQDRHGFRKYEGCLEDVLWDCPTSARMEELRRQAPSDTHWFTTYDQVLRDPHGEIWINRSGEIASLPHT